MLFATREEEIAVNLSDQVFYFYAHWMSLHSKFMLMIQAIEKVHPNIFFTAVDVAQFNNQCKRFNIESVPTVIAMKKGKEVARISNTFSTATFKSILDDICVS